MESRPGWPRFPGRLRPRPGPPPRRRRMRAPAPTSSDRRLPSGGLRPPAPPRPAHRDTRKLSASLPCVVSAPLRNVRQYRDMKLSPSASARSRPSSPAAWAAMGSPATSTGKALVAAHVVKGGKVARGAGKIGCFGEIRLRQLGVVEGQHGAGHQDVHDQRAIVELTRDGQGVFGPLQAGRDGEPDRQQPRVGDRTYPDRGSDIAVAVTLVGEDGVEPGHAFAEPSARDPDPLQRRRELQRRTELRRVAAPRMAPLVGCPFRVRPRKSTVPRHRAIVIPASPPCRCSGRDDGSARPRPRLTPPTFPGHIGGRSPAAGIA